MGTSINIGSLNDELKYVMEPLLYSCELKAFHEDLLKAWDDFECEGDMDSQRLEDMKAKGLLTAMISLSSSKKFCMEAYKEEQYRTAFADVVHKILSKDNFTVMQFLVALGTFIEIKGTEFHQDFRNVQGKVTDKINQLLKKGFKLSKQLLNWINGFFSTFNMTKLLDSSSAKQIQEGFVTMILGICKISRFPEHSDYKEIYLLSAEQMPLYSEICNNCLIVLNFVLQLIWKHFLDKEECPKTMFVKSSAKRFLPDVIILAFGHMAKHDWTTSGSRKEAKNLIGLACKLTHSKNIEELLTGHNIVTSSETAEDTSTEPIFHEGILNLVLEKVCSRFSNDGWKRDPSLKHVVVFATLKLNYPSLNQYFRSLIPLLLNLVEDYQEGNQVLGTGCLHHLLENVNSSDLNLYNHSELIYQVLFKMLYRSSCSTLRVLLPCLREVLFKMEPFPNRITLEKVSRWDATMRKLVSNLEFESKRDVKEVLLENISGFVRDMKINSIKYLSAMIRTVNSVLEIYDGPAGQIRKMGLELLLALILNCWPVIEKHVGAILKMVLRLIMDLSMDGNMTSQEAKCFVEQKSLEIIKLLSLSCSPGMVKNYLNSALDAHTNEKYNCVKDFLNHATKEIDGFEPELTENGGLK